MEDFVLRGTDEAECFEAVRQNDALTCRLLFLQPTLVQDMTEFKRSLPLFPLVKPHINFMAAKLWARPAGRHAAAARGALGRATVRDPAVFPTYTIILLSGRLSSDWACISVCVRLFVCASACECVCLCVCMCGRLEPLEEMLGNKYLNHKVSRGCRHSRDDDRGHTRLTSC